MKTLFTLTLVAAFGLALPTATFAQKKTKPDAAPAVGAQKSDAKPAAASAPAPEKKPSTRPLPMNTRVDSIDAAAKTFTMKRLKDGVEVKHVVSDTTEIKNGEAAAKFEDIKVGDWVSGLRMKKGETEYEVVKITKFGPKVAKAAKSKDDATPAAGGAPVKPERKDSVPEAKKP